MEIIIKLAMNMLVEELMVNYEYFRNNIKEK